MSEERTIQIAVIGTGISGMGAAWALSQHHDVTVYEARDRLGGHSNTVDVQTPHGPVPVDTGFIVYNEATYPHLTRFFDHLDVPTEESDMSFSFSLDGELEYAGSVKGMLADPRNLLRSRYRSMIGDILRFRKEGLVLLESAQEQRLDVTLSDAGYSDAFLDDYLVPMAAAIWSARPEQIRRYPAETFLRFFRNHGLITITDRPQWRTVTGGSRQYVRRVVASFEDRIRLASPVTALSRGGDGVKVETPHGAEMYDHVVLATHSDQSLSILGDDASDEEVSVLSAIRYEPNRAVLHSDADLMPVNRRTWSSWNYVTSSDGREQSKASVTYWMNRLQNIDESIPLFVSLNPIRDPDPSRVHGEFLYSHPQFDGAALDAQRRTVDIQGRKRTWFAGAWLGYGFHEDGLQSGLEVAAALGSPAPWHHSVEPMSSTPSLSGVLV